MNHTYVSKSLIASLLTIALSSMTAFAQDSDSNSEGPAPTTSQEKVSPNKPSIGVSLDGIWIALSGVGLKFDYYMTDSFSMGLSGVLIPKHQAENTSYTDFKRYRYNFEHNQILLSSTFMATGTFGTRGLYINPAIGYQTTSITEYSVYNLSGSASGAVAKASVGYQWVLARHLRLAAGGGLATYQSIEASVKDNSGKEIYKDKIASSGDIVVDLQIGYVF